MVCKRKFYSFLGNEPNIGQISPLLHLPGQSIVRISSHFPCQFSLFLTPIDKSTGFKSSLTKIRNYKHLEIIKLISSDFLCLTAS